MKMKKSSLAFLIATLMMSTQTMASTGQIFNVIQTQQPLPFQMDFQVKNQTPELNIETPYRCQTTGFHASSISTTLPVNLNDFRLIKITKTDPLPRYEVNGYSFNNTPIDEALQTLVDEAGILVYTEDKTYPSLSAQNLYGDLESVIGALLDNVDMYFTYNENTNKLNITKRADFTISLPKNRLVILGVLDALRGAGIENIVPDWNESILRLSLSRQEEKTVQKLIESIQTNGEMLIADTSVYHLNGYQNWNQILMQYGLDKIHSANNGLQGKLLVLGHQRTYQSLIQTLQRTGSAQLLSDGLAVVPNGWRMFFDTSKCTLGTAPFMQQLMLSLNPNMGHNSKINTTLSIHTPMGELSSFNVNASLDDELAIIGLPDNQMGGELLILIKLKLIRLVGENQQ